MKFKIGDVVELPSGGPKLTVQSTGDEAVMCVWFDRDLQLQSTRIDVNLLVLATPSQERPE